MDKPDSDKKKIHFFVIFFLKKFGHMKKKLYLCIVKQKRTNPMYKTISQILVSIANDVKDGDSIRIVNGEVIVTNSFGTEIYREYHN